MPDGNIPTNQHRNVYAEYNHDTIDDSAKHLPYLFSIGRYKVEEHVDAYYGTAEKVCKHNLESGQEDKWEHKPHCPPYPS